MLNVVIKDLSIGVGIVYWASFRRSFLGIRYLYHWYSHTISVSNDCIGGSNPWGVFFASWYCCHSHCNLSLGMVMRYRPLFSYMCATSKCVWITLVLVSISLSGLHSLIDMCSSGIIVAGVTNLMSCCCSEEK